jgi:hypothetical protein
MNRTICIGLMVLPVYLYSAALGNACSSNVPMFKDKLPITTALVAYSANFHSRLMPWQISARDDQTEDCLRSGICKD